MQKYCDLAATILLALALLPAPSLAQERGQGQDQPLRAQIGVQAATSLFEITDAASNPRLMLDDTGKLTIFGTIESTTGGIIFPDGSMQTQAATSGLWSIYNADVFYENGDVGIGVAFGSGKANNVKLLVRNDTQNAWVFRVEDNDEQSLLSVLETGKVGVGTANPQIALDVHATNSAAPSIITNGGMGYAVPSGESLRLGHWSGSTFTTRLAIDAAGNVGIGWDVPTARLDVRAVTGEPSIVTRGGRDYATWSGEYMEFGHWDNNTFTERMSISPTGDVGIGAVNSSVKLNVRNIGDGPYIFNVEKSDGTNLFQVQNDGDVVFANASKFSQDGDLTLTSGSAPTIVLDHPLDPAEKQLRFTAVEAPERYTFHSGTVVLNAAGAATVTLPDWYEATNTDLRYQLTAIGAPGPNLYIAQKVQNNRFEIAGGTAGMEVSWQVTATRADAAARAQPFEAEARKAAEHRGRYYTPEAHGHPASLRIKKADDIDNMVRPPDNR